MSDLTTYPNPEPDFGPFAWIILLGSAVATVAKRLDDALARAEVNHNRAELLDAYRHRHEWKTSDIAPLNTLGVSDVARRRMARVTGVGRPIIKAHRPFGANFAERVAACLPLVEEDAGTAERRKALKQWPWWPHHVEALYRGEKALARQRGITKARDHAEEAVGRALGLSPAKVHQICTKIRQFRKQDSESANFPSMILADFDKWMETGQWPDDKVLGSNSNGPFGRPEVEKV